jgi:S-adenosylmethionine decarboxylase proenzyme
METVGQHLLMTIRNIPDVSILSKVETIKPLLDTIVRECDLHVVSEAGHQFTPFGATYVYVLEESHMSIHTYPEKNSAYMDIFCCNMDFNAEKAVGLVRTLFNTPAVDYHVYTR